MVDETAAHVMAEDEVVVDEVVVDEIVRAPPPRLAWPRQGQHRCLYWDGAVACHLTVLVVPGEPQVAPPPWRVSLAVVGGAKELLRGHSDGTTPVEPPGDHFAQNHCSGRRA